MTVTRFTAVVLLPTGRAPAWERLFTFSARNLVSTVDSNGRTIWIADAHRGDGKRFVVHADEKLTAG